MNQPAPTTNLPGEPVGAHGKALVTALVAASGSALVAVYSQFQVATSDGVVTKEELAYVALALIAGFGLVKLTPFTALFGVAKAVVAGLTAAVTTGLQSYSDGTITNNEWGLVVMAAVIAAGAAYGVANAARTTVA